MEPERYFRFGLSFVISNEREKSFSIVMAPMRRSYKGFALSPSSRKKRSFPSAARDDSHAVPALAPHFQQREKSFFVVRVVLFHSSKNLP